MSAHGKLNQEEILVAAIAGTGLTLAITAGVLIGFGTADNDLTRLLALVGIALIVAGTALWLILLKPWEKFDDLQTPHYTGHEHEHGHEPEAEAMPEHAAAAPEMGEIGAAIEMSRPAPVVAEAKPAAEAVQPVEKAAAQEAAPAMAKPAPAEAVRNDLKIIEGIGPKSEAALNASGVTTFALVAAMNPAELERLVKEVHKVRLVGNAATWPHQAMLAAAGDMTALHDFQARLKHGTLYDNLTLVEGIGLQTQSVLFDAGIRNFAELAAATPEQLKEITQKASLPVDPSTWPMQAQMIVSHDLSGLENFKAQLRGGRAG